MSLLCIVRARSNYELINYQLLDYYQTISIELTANRGRSGTAKLTSGLRSSNHLEMKNTNICAGYRYPPQIGSHPVWLYHRFALSLCDIEELLAARGVV